MNLHLAPGALLSAHSHSRAPSRHKFNPRRKLVEEVVAGFLWMMLDIPEDTTLDEVTSLAQQLVTRIQQGDDEALIQAWLDNMQRHHLCRPADAAMLRDLACRAVTLVKAYAAS